MGTYVYTIRKSNPVRALDLREGSPTHGQTLRMARLSYLYKPSTGGWWTDREQNLWDAHEERANEGWDAWEDRPDLVVGTDRKKHPEAGAEVLAWTGGGVWRDTVDRPGEKVGYVVPIPGAKRGQPQVAIGSREQVEAYKISAALSHPRSYAYRTAEEGTWDIYVAHVDPDEPKGTYRIEYRWDGGTASEDTAMLAIFEGLVARAKVREQESPEGAKLLASAVAEQQAREWVRDHLRKAVYPTSSPLPALRKAMESAGADVRCAGYNVESRAFNSRRGTVEDALAATQEALESAQEALRVLRRAEARRDRANAAYAAQRDACRAGETLLQRAQEAFWGEQETGKAACLVERFHAVPAYAYRDLRYTTELRDSLDATSNIIREGGKWTDLPPMVQRLRAGDYVNLNEGDECLRPSRWVGISCGSLWAKHYPHTSDGDVADLALGLPEDQQAAAFVNLRRDLAAVLQREEAARRTARAARAARQEARA